MRDCYHQTGSIKLTVLSHTFISVLLREAFYLKGIHLETDNPGMVKYSILGMIHAAPCPWESDFVTCLNTSQSC